MRVVVKVKVVSSGTVLIEAYPLARRPMSIVSMKVVGPVRVTVLSSGYSGKARILTAPSSTVIVPVMLPLETGSGLTGVVSEARGALVIVSEPCVRLSVVVSESCDGVAVVVGIVTTIVVVLVAGIMIVSVVVVV